MDARRDDLGVGVGEKLVTEALLLRPHLGEVLDDAVVHHRDLVAADMGMGIGLIGYAVGRPAGMGNADGPMHCVVLQQRIQGRHLAGGANPGDGVRAVDDRETRGVVAPVFQSPQALDEDGDDVSLGDRADYSAHGNWSIKWC